MIEDEEKREDEESTIGEDVLDGLADESDEEDDPLMAEAEEDDTKEKDWM